jgi:outer membrane lipoprotein-sorting protein
MTGLPALLLLVLVGGSAEGGACEDRADLIAGFAAVQTVHASYTETKHIALMSAPLVSSGTVVLVKPDRLRMDMVEPVRQSVVVDGAKIRVVHHDLGTEQRVDLGPNADARAIVRSILLAMSGQVDLLGEEYGCTLDEAPDGEVQLDLTPLRSPMKEMIRSLQVVLGPNRTLRQVTIREEGDDTAVLVFTDVVYDTPMTPAQVEALFGP